MAGRQRQKLVLLDTEISLIRGVIAHTELNDQMITAIFSHLSRTINHREIGYFRDRKNPKYQSAPIASKADVEAFLAKYGRFERVAKEFELLPQDPSFRLVQKAAEAMKSAVAAFNNPSVRWKSEIFIVNALISWTYLMHAYYRKEDIDIRYRRGNEVVLTDDGNEKLWDLAKCIKENHCPLPNAVKSNLRYLLVIRHEIEHRSSQNIDRYLEPKLQACALNFENWMCIWFGSSHSIANELAFAIQFAEISLRRNEDIVGEKGLPDIIQTANRLVEDKMPNDDYNNPSYSYRVFVIPRTINNRKKADSMAIFAPEGSEIEMAVREVERSKYTATQIVDKMKAEGFSDFNVHGKNGFVSIWRKLNAKDPKKNYGVLVAKQWYWYERMVDEVRSTLEKREQ